MDLERVALPGIGLRHVLTTSRGYRVGVVSHPSGRRELVFFRRDDPGSALGVVPLSGDEANALAELLGAARIVEHLAELHRQVEGLVSIQVPILTGSPYAGRALGETQARSRTGASIVAVVRDREVIASPTPDFRFEPRDVVVVVGTADGTAAVSELLNEG